MCIIIDANAAHHFVKGHKDAQPVRQWLAKSGKIVTSTTLRRELAKAGLAALLIELDRAKKHIKAQDELCVAHESILKNNVSVRSNDAHILALIKTTNCNIVYSHDILLHQDIKDGSIIKHKCSIYQSAEHKHLLCPCSC